MRCPGSPRLARPIAVVVWIPGSVRLAQAPSSETPGIEAPAVPETGAQAARPIPLEDVPDRAEATRAKLDALLPRNATRPVKLSVGQLLEPPLSCASKKRPSPAEWRSISDETPPRLVPARCKATSSCARSSCARAPSRVCTFEASSGLLAGEFRIVEHSRNGRVPKALLMRSSGTHWESVSRHYHGFSILTLRFLRTQTRTLQNAAV